MSVKVSWSGGLPFYFIIEGEEHQPRFLCIIFLQGGRSRRLTLVDSTVGIHHTLHQLTEDQVSLAFTAQLKALWDNTVAGWNVQRGWLDIPLLFLATSIPNLHMASVHLLQPPGSIIAFLNTIKTSVHRMMLNVGFPRPNAKSDSL